MKDTEFFYPENRAQWRKWLEENHDSKPFIWLVYYKKETGKPTISWSEAVDEALCFGWIDSTAKSWEGGGFVQYFTKRKPHSTWSKINKEKINQLMSQGLISKAGMDSIERAKQNGSWEILDEVEELIIPTDLENAFKTKPGSSEYFMSLSKSVRKSLLQWLVLAKRQETRQKRILEIVESASQRKKPKAFG